jgi:hypothetical protein
MDELPVNGLQSLAVSRAGDLWILGPHRLLCGDVGELGCDVVVRRWQQFTGKAARLEGSDLTFEDMKARRLAGQSASLWLGPISGSHQGQRPLRLHRDRGNPPSDNRPDTWLHPNASLHVRFLLQRGHRSLIASPLSSRLFVHPGRSPRRSWFSPRSASAAASSGPKRWLSNVHNGLVEVALCGPTASGGVARTLAPEGKLTVSALLRYGYV